MWHLRVAGQRLRRAGGPPSHSLSQQAVTLSISKLYIPPPTTFLSHLEYHPPQIACPLLDDIQLPTSTHEEHAPSQGLACQCPRKPCQATKVIGNGGEAMSNLVMASVQVLRRTCAFMMRSM